MGKGHRIGFLGFGEAGMAFAAGLAGAAYDRKTGDQGTASAKHADYAKYAVRDAESSRGLVGSADLILSLVTADQALCAARDLARSDLSSVLYLDMNSVSPDTKRRARDLIEAAGGQYVDVAVMAPVHPVRRAVPLLLSGPHAAAAAWALADLGFPQVRIVEGAVGQASSIKMIRSIMVKGIEALTAECMLAAAQAGVVDEVLSTLDAGHSEREWRARADYNLDRMMVHGLRRAAEMEEVVRTLDALGTGSVMARATVERQRAIGAMGVTSVSLGLEAKLRMLVGSTAKAAA